jgi:hypothetical protein
VSNMLNTTPLNRALTALTAPTSNDGVGGTCVHSTQNALKQPLSTLITAHMRCLVVLAVLAQLLAAASVTLADGVPGPSRDLRRTNSAQRRYPEMTGLHPRLEVSILDRAPSTDRYRVSARYRCGCGYDVAKAVLSGFRQGASLIKEQAAQ